MKEKHRAKSSKEKRRNTLLTAPKSKGGERKYRAKSSSFGKLRRGREKKENTGLSVQRREERKGEFILFLHNLKTLNFMI